MSEIPIGKVELTSYTETDELHEILDALNYGSKSWFLQRVPNPDRDNNEPDFYLIRKEEEEE